MNLLNKNTIETITKKIIPKDCTYNIRKSDTSNSVYLCIMYSDMNTTIRFSDHITTKTNIKTVLIKSTTKPTLVERTINKSILGLKHLSISIKLGLNNDNRKEKSNGQ